MRTLVVALAATHSPEQVNFVLVDFKGGATFLGLENLPHTSAVITNLEEEAELVDRMHDAISGEMTRRQELLRASGGFANVDAYEAARRDGRDDLEPLPALVIILDEFSELLGQHPDFADLFTAVGRLGRSLHIHVLLASQRLEEGRLRGLDSHLSYRIGLKTFSAGESRQVLGVTDAYHLPPQPGAGFLKTDADTVLRFDAAYVSGPLAPEDTGTRPATQPVLTHPVLFTSWEAIDNPVLACAPETTTGALDMVRSSKETTLLDLVVDAAVTAGKLRGMAAHRIWLPPLPEEYPLSHLIEETGTDLPVLACPLGLIDRPAKQCEDPYVVSLAGASGHLALCGGPRSGKTMALHTLVCAMALIHPSPSVRFYLLDLGGRGLDDLTSLPHVAGIAHRLEPEKVRRMLDEVTGFIDEPEKNIHTFLVIDGWHILGRDFEECLPLVERIAADGLEAHVHLVAAVQRWTDLRPSVRDLVINRVELKLPEAMDSLINRKAQQAIPTKAGRGITPAAEQMLIAVTGPEDTAHIASVAADRGDTPVKAMAVLPDTLRRVDLVDDGHELVPVPLGRGGPRLSKVGWDPGAGGHLLCIGGRYCGKTTVLKTVAAGLTKCGREKYRLVVIDPRRSHLGAFSEHMLAGYAAVPDAMSTAISDTVATLSARLPGPDITPQQLKDRSWWTGPDIVVMIDDFDLVPGGLCEPLAPLVPHSPDIGLHVVLARKAGGIARALWDPLISQLKDQQPSVLLMDCDKEEGPLFGLKPVHQPPGRGQWLVDGERIGLMQVATP